MKMFSIIRFAAATVLAGAFLTFGSMAEEPAFQRVLFLGNSITKHGPKEDIGWTGNWGMAASSEERDYVHLVTAGLSTYAKSPCETMVQNIAGFERNYATYNLKSQLEDAREFQPDLVILAIGENVPKLDSDEAKADFESSVLTLLNGLKRASDPVIIVRSSFWANEAKDGVLRKVCEEVDGIFVSIDELDSDESNFARAERDFSHKGVAAHPGDKGMKAIADAILAAVPTKQSKADE